MEELLIVQWDNLRIPGRDSDGRLLVINEAIVTEGEALRHLVNRYQV